MNWNQPLCGLCWNARNPERPAFHLGLGAWEVCSDCGTPTNDGIYFRADPKTVNYPAPDEDDEDI